jgi:hypothetical protein
MRAPDVVFRSQLHADADGGGLLAGIKMHEARYFPVREFNAHTLFKGADRRHQPVGFEKRGPVELHGLFLREEPNAAVRVGAI